MLREELESYIDGLKQELIREREELGYCSFMEGGNLYAQIKLLERIIKRLEGILLNNQG